MTARRTIVYGAGGHGKVVGDILLALRDSTFVGFVDDNSQLAGTHILGLPVLGNGEWLREEIQRDAVAVALGIGDNFIRGRIAEQCSGWGAELATAVHPTASVSASACLGVGTVVMAQAAINPCSRIGRGAVINTGAVVEHDVHVGEYAHIAPNATMAGASRLGTYSLLALNAAILQCVRVGSYSVLGAGAVAVRDIPDHVVAFGVPARIQKRCCATLDANQSHTQSDH